MFISKSMRVFALSLILVSASTTQSVDTATKIQAALCPTTLVNAAFHSLVWFACSGIMLAKNTTPQDFKVGVITSAAVGGTLGWLGGYRQYIQKFENKIQREIDRTSIDRFLDCVKNDNLNSFMKLDHEALKKAYERSGYNSPVRTAACWGAEQIFDALRAKGFETTKDDYKYLWDNKIKAMKADDARKKAENDAEQAIGRVQPAIAARRANAFARARTRAKQYAHRGMQEGFAPGNGLLT